MEQTFARERDPDLEASSDQISLYVYEEGSDELLDAVHDATALAIPAVGDRISFAEASADGDFEERTVRYREEAPSVTYVVARRDITYLHVEYDIDGLDEDRNLVSEVRAWVTEVGDGNDR